ncbi:hypothetical protein [Kitasatospora aureofaciens]|nr:hypothetical protein [Kitasatospora aureofaciens]MBV6702914.1 hypothetical protein [Kitasatospora aureofaciens]
MPDESKPFDSAVRSRAAFQRRMARAREPAARQRRYAELCTIQAAAYAES